MKPVQISRIMTTEVISVAPDCRLSTAIETMREHNISILVIARNEKPLGVLTERDVIRFACNHIAPERTLVEAVMTSPVFSVTEDTNIFQVYDELVRHRIRHIVVVDAAGRLAGLATLTNILGGMSIEYFIELKQVTSIMSRNISTLDPDDTVGLALELMSRRQISCVVVARENRPVGIITERDITWLYCTGVEENARLDTVMSKPVRTVAENTFIPEVNSIMREEKLRHLVVVDRFGLLAGVISQSDVARRIEDHYIAFLRSLIKQQREQIRYEHERFDMLFQQNPNAVISHNVNGNIMDINPACVALSGYSQQEISDKPFEFLIHPEDISRAYESFRKASHGRTGHAEFRVKMKSGSSVHVFNSYLPIYIDGKLHSVYSIMHDISERKWIQQQMHHAEQRMHLLSKAVEEAGDSVVITDNHGTIEFVNDAFTRITGFSADEAIGSNASILKSGEQSAAFYKKMWADISQGMVWSSKLVDRRKNGEFFPSELTISPVHNIEGKITHYIGIKRDLTEREQLEEKFRQAQKMEAIGTLVGGIAHDFNNMLTSMTGNLYLAKKQVAEMPEIAQKLNNIESIAFRAADMIKQLLTFARKDIVSIKQIPLTLFIEETFDLLRSSVPENIEIHQHVCDETLYVNGDATQLHQVLMNLISNARDALAEAKNPCITISLERCDADHKHPFLSPGSYAHLSVEDNGCGIPEEQMKHLFEPFHTTKEQGKGTGLGLAMVFGSVKRHGGIIKAESIKGRGSTFHIHLPLLETREVSHAVKKQETVEDGNGELILLVDDKEDILEMERELLESLGYRVLMATNGQHAVNIFSEHPEDIDLIIMDVVMPVMSGGKAAERIRRIRPEVSIIFSTGYDKNLLADMANETVISKPFAIEEISRLIRQSLKVEVA